MGSMIRASAVRDLVGDIQRELMTTGTAIIDYKNVVVDPLSRSTARSLQEATISVYENTLGAIATTALATAKTTRPPPGQVGIARAPMH
jgi:predicted YcjX-like family ATPase